MVGPVVTVFVLYAGAGAARNAVEHRRQSLSRTVRSDGAAVIQSTALTVSLMHVTAHTY